MSRAATAGKTIGVLLALGVCLAAPAAALDDPAALSIAVAPFAAVAPPGQSVPDSARLLADRLGTRGVGRVVGPGQFGAQALASPTGEQVKGWAAEADVGVVVVGRSTLIGRRISLDVRLRSSASGQVIGTFVAEAARPEELNAAISRLADQVVASALDAGIAPPVAASAAAASEATPGDAGAEEDEDGEDGSAGFFGISGRKDEPISIQSDELEAFQTGGKRRFVFKSNVRVKQGTMRLKSNQLDAFYPEGESQPDRLVATGKVRLDQEGKTAFCRKAVYLRREQKVICTGNLATLIQQGDRVMGKEIEFYLESERLVVRGGADVRLEASDDDDGSGGGG